VDSLPHDQLMRSLALFGKNDNPRFKHPRNIVRPADDILAEIRTARPAHEEALRQFNDTHNPSHHKETSR
ncbi:hypothetical protein V2J94_49005, partial [Streptomyces sp. DSM 41524]|nr:hypothetical protein [Streptomyces sp. DSM 41524]